MHLYWLGKTLISSAKDTCMEWINGWHFSRRTRRITTGTTLRYISTQITRVRWTRHFRSVQVRLIMSDSSENKRRAWKACPSGEKLRRLSDEKIEKWVKKSSLENGRVRIVDKATIRWPIAYIQVREAVQDLQPSRTTECKSSITGTSTLGRVLEILERIDTQGGRASEEGLWSHD